MATMFSLTFSIEAALKQMGVVMNGRIPQAIARGINRTADSEKTVMSRGVAQDLGIKVGVAKEAIKVQRATPTRLVARVMAKGARIPLIDLNAKGPEPSRGRGQGVSYRVQGKTTRIPNAFIATVGRGRHRGVFVRKGARRLPIRKLFGASIAHVFEKHIPLGEARRNEVLVKNVQHEIEFALSKGV